MDKEIEYMENRIQDVIGAIDNLNISAKAAHLSISIFSRTWRNELLQKYKNRSMVDRLLKFATQLQ